MPGQTPHREVCAISGLVEGAKAEQRGGRLVEGGLLQNQCMSLSQQQSIDNMTSMKLIQAPSYRRALHLHKAQMRKRFHAHILARNSAAHHCLGIPWGGDEVGKVKILQGSQVRGRAGQRINENSPGSLKVTQGVGLSAVPVTRADSFKA